MATHISFKLDRNKIKRTKTVGAVLFWIYKIQQLTDETVTCSNSLFAETLLNVCPDMEFLEVLTEGLERVLLVRGGGSEVITIYSWLDKQR